MLRLPLPSPGMADQHPPFWLQPWARRVWPRLAMRRAQGPCPQDWQQIACSSRADLSSRLSHSCALRHVQAHPVLGREPIICFATSGTTGHPIRVPSLPSVAAEYRVYHRRALAAFGIQLRAGRGQVAAVLAGYQQCCFTYASINPLQGESGLVKLNLMPHEWRSPEDRARYLDALAPELISGDPVSLATLAELDMAHQPRALLSTSMAMSQVLRQQLETRFACPVLDLYSMNEAGPIAVFLPEEDGWLPLQPGLFIELLDEAGQAVPAGERGEITLSGGFNPLLPLLRYRSGDHACWKLSKRGWLLGELQGRAPVRFRHARGHWLNNIEVTHALKRFALCRFALHQDSSDGLHLRLDPWPADAEQAEIRAALQALLGDLPLTLQRLQADDKLRQYSRD